MQSKWKGPSRILLLLPRCTRRVKYRVLSTSPTHPFLCVCSSCLSLFCAHQRQTRRLKAGVSLAGANRSASVCLSGLSSLASSSSIFPAVFHRQPPSCSAASHTHTHWHWQRHWFLASSRCCRWRTVLGASTEGCRVDQSAMPVRVLRVGAGVMPVS